MMYYDRSLPKGSALLTALSPGGSMRSVLKWIQNESGTAVNARLELRKNRGDLRRGAVQVYLGRNAVLTIIARDKGAISFACHRELVTQAFRALPERCTFDDVPIPAILNHLEQCADRPVKDDEGAVHAGFMCRYGRGAVAGDPLLAVDSEVQVGFEGDGQRTGSDLRDAFEADLTAHYKMRGAVPRKLDVLGIDPDGSLLVIELKGRGGDLNRAVIQAAVHVDRFERLLSQGTQNQSHINLGVHQKKQLGVLPDDWPGVTSTRIMPVIAMPDNPDGWYERWLRATRNARGQAGERLRELQLWLLDDAGKIIEKQTIEEAASQSWIDFVQAQQIVWKKSWLEPVAARAPGRHISYRHGKRMESHQTYDRFIPAEYAVHNLLPDIRNDALRRFAEHDIRWWGSLDQPDGSEGPTNHLRSSQIHCVNTLMSLHHSDTLLTAIQQLVPQAVRLINLESEHPVAFEWIGAKNYLGEKGRRRGQYRTSIDAFLVAELQDGSRTGLFLEWKLTETYDPETNLRYSARGTDRSEIYRPLYERAKEVFAERPHVEAFHYDPHDQLFRQALLANEVRLAGEFEVDRMLLVDCVPGQNDALRSAVPTGLAHLGGTIDIVWERLLAGPLLRFTVFDPLAWMSLSEPLNRRYGALFGATPQILCLGQDPED